LKKIKILASISGTKYCFYETEEAIVNDEIADELIGIGVAEEIIEGQKPKRKSAK
jgi:hypothetical protein